MKKLLQSSKFWAITVGAILGSLIYYFLGDGEGLSNTFPVVLIGLYGANGLVDKAGDAGAKIMGRDKEI